MSDRDVLSDQGGRPRHWNYVQAEVPDFASFAEPFAAGWNAHRREGDVDAQAFTRLLMDAYNTSGAMLAHKVATGEMTEQEARVAFAENSSDSFDEQKLGAHLRESADQVKSWPEVDQRSQSIRGEEPPRHGS